MQWCTCAMCMPLKSVGRIQHATTAATADNINHIRLGRALWHVEHRENWMISTIAYKWCAIWPNQPYEHNSGIVRKTGPMNADCTRYEKALVWPMICEFDTIHMHENGKDEQSKRKNKQKPKNWLVWKSLDSISRSFLMPFGQFTGHTRLLHCMYLCAAFSPIPHISFYVCIKYKRLFNHLQIYIPMRTDIGPHSGQPQHNSKTALLLPDAEFSVRTDLLAVAHNTMENNEFNNATK